MGMKSFNLGFSKSKRMGKKFSQRIKENELVLKMVKEKEDPSE